MALKWIMAGLALCIALAFGAASAADAAPAEPLVVTQLADPDPNYVPSPDEQHSGKRAASMDALPVLGAEMQDFSRAIGRAALLQRQSIQVECNSRAPVPEGGPARWAWEANCRYERR